MFLHVTFMSVTLDVWDGRVPAGMLPGQLQPNYYGTRPEGQGLPAPGPQGPPVWGPLPHAPPSGAPAAMERPYNNDAGAPRTSAAPYNTPQR